jgi:hypothetical protein
MNIYLISPTSWTAIENSSLPSGSNSEGGGTAASRCSRHLQSGGIKEILDNAARPRSTEAGELNRDGGRPRSTEAGELNRDDAARPRSTEARELNRDDAARPRGQQRTGAQQGRRPRSTEAESSPGRRRPAVVNRGQGVQCKLSYRTSTSWRRQGHLQADVKDRKCYQCDHDICFHECEIRNYVQYQELKNLSDKFFSMGNNTGEN